MLLRILLKLNVISSWPQSEAIRKRCSNLAKCITGNGRSKNLVPIGTNRWCLDKQNGCGSRKAADTGGISQPCICKKRDPYPFCLGTDRKWLRVELNWAKCCITVDPDSGRVSYQHDDCCIICSVREPFIQLKTGSRKAADTGGISQPCICKKRDPYPFCLGTDRKMATELRT